MAFEQVVYNPLRNHPATCFFHSLTDCYASFTSVISGHFFSLIPSYDEVLSEASQLLEKTKMVQARKGGNSYFTGGTISVGSAFFLFSC